MRLPTRLLAARLVVVALPLLAISGAHAFDVTIATGPSSGGNWAGGTFTPIAAGATVNAGEIASRLAAGPVAIVATGSDALTVNAALSWSANTLTLQAGGDIRIDQSMSLTATAGLALAYGLSAVQSQNPFGYFLDSGVSIDLASGGSYATRVGSDGSDVQYTLLTALGSSGSTTGSDLQGMQGNVTGNYALAANIDASASAGWNGGAGFAPVGTSASPFSGRFDGLGHAIDNLRVSLAGIDGVGLFGWANAATLRNIGLGNADIAGRNYVGPLLGRGQGENRIDNAWSSGSVFSNSTNSTQGGAGGLVGWLTGIVSNSHSSATVEATSNAGGLVGRLGDNASDVIASRVTHASASGNVRANVGSGGGLVGLSFGRVDNSHATGNVNGGRSLGGLIGNARMSVYWKNLVSVNLQDLYNINYATGNVTGNQNPHGPGTNANQNGNYIGGLVGEATGGYVSIANSFATGNVSGYNGVGGLLGYVTPSSATGYVPWLYDTYAAGGTVTGNNYVGGLIGQVEGPVVIQQSYAATGLLTATPNDTSTPKVGGIIGYKLNSGSLISIYTAVWNRETTGTDHMSGEDFLGVPEHVTGYMTGADYLATFHTVGAMAAQMRTLEPYYMAGFYGGNPNDGGYSILTDSTASGRDFIENDPSNGRLFNIFRLYEGNTYPLLMAFLTPLEVAANNGVKAYDGTPSSPFGVTYIPANPDPTRLKGTPIVSADGSSVGVHATTVSGLYSDLQQGGYNIQPVPGTLTILPSDELIFVDGFE
ncbi:MAG TPA: hypothetical protein VFN13_05855 [Rudaea sp.]|nr:hypothetical protein [Rudaea sp.]